jgi:UDP-2,4-diacetamido-2,4,6-trideoxy-beta-L-altropyranose hydrolase
MDLLVRADASAAIGTGHVMRCLALAQAWVERGGRARFASAACPEALAERLASEGFECERLHTRAGGAEDARATLRLARKHGARWIALDGYHFSPPYQAQLRAAGARVLLFDDEARAPAYAADLLLNQNLHASSGDYGWKSGSARLLLGSQYALLRREFRHGAGVHERVAPRARRLLVTLGGADPSNATERVLRALRRLRRADFEVLCLAGAANPHFDTLKHYADPPHLRVEHSTSDMPARMAWADLAISAAGTTTWELCFMGLPTLSIVLADNQQRIAHSLAERGAALSLGRAEALREDVLERAVGELAEDEALRATLSSQGRALVDGRGAERVADALWEAA